MFGTNQRHINFGTFIASKNLKKLVGQSTPPAGYKAKNPAVFPNAVSQLLHLTPSSKCGNRDYRMDEQIGHRWNRKLVKPARCSLQPHQLAFEGWSVDGADTVLSVKVLGVSFKIVPGTDSAG